MLTILPTERNYAALMHCGWIFIQGGGNVGGGKSLSLEEGNHFHWDSILHSYSSSRQHHDYANSVVAAFQSNELRDI